MHLLFSSFPQIFTVFSCPQSGMYVCVCSLFEGYDFERVIDDFVFLMFFVGNDFLPHLPCLDIRDGAVEFLYAVYKRVLPALGSYLTDGGDVNLSNVDVIMTEVGQIEDEVFRRKAADQKQQDQRREWRKQRNKRGGSGAIAADAARGGATAIVGRITALERAVRGKEVNLQKAEDAEKALEKAKSEAMPLVVSQKQ